MRPRTPGHRVQKKHTADSGQRTERRCAGGGAVLFAEIGVGFGDPVGARGAENIEVDGIFDGFCLVRDAGGDDEGFAGADGEDLAVVEGEAESALEDVGDLFIGMAVAGDDGAFAEDDARQHGLLAVHHLAIHEGVEGFDGHGVEACVVDGTLGGQTGISWRVGMKATRIS